MYIVLNLLWPTANWVVFVVVSRRAGFRTGEDQVKAVGFSCTENISGQPLVLDDKDSADWRELCKNEIASRRQSLAAQLQPAVAELLPSGHHAMSRQFARRIVKNSGTLGASALLESRSQLEKVVAGMWRDVHELGCPLPDALTAHEDGATQVSDFESGWWSESDSEEESEEMEDRETCASI
eukprot:TRINITY_DN12846_c0_g1_i6.p1 TRINITY_DN12846_c0_g1~~TRINITY_DN12846_c0_g1_i6.p1  ORF type:complete len:182 (+),score=48.09 TRINITY_DN12846_c0_g1_i6:205-750(+)